MSLEHAILGFLNYQPLSGYDLKKMFDTTVQHFWSADQSQIYRTLAKLTEQGWADMEILEQSERPDRKIYHLTAAGREELQRWLAEPLPASKPHNAELVKVFFGGQLTDETLLALFETAAGQMRATLEHYQQLLPQIRTYADVVKSPREMFCWELTLELGIKSATANLEWAESIIDRIKHKRLPPLKRAHR